MAFPKFSQELRGESSNPPMPAFSARPIPVMPVLPRARGGVKTGEPRGPPGAMPKAAVLRHRPITEMSGSTPGTDEHKRRRTKEVHRSVAVPTRSHQECAVVDEGGTTEHTPVNGLREWWIARALTLPLEKHNGWVVAAMIDEYIHEEHIAEACEKATFTQRLTEAGLQDLLNPRAKPRQRCKQLVEKREVAAAFLDEAGQRSMLESIRKPAMSYSAGLKCWAAFCDSVGEKVHFPASERLVVRYSAIFENKATFRYYLTRLKWAHTFLRLPNSWFSAVVKQVVRGGMKAGPAPKVKVAVNSRQVSALVKCAMREGESDVAALMALVRQFLLRVPSEGIPQEWRGLHSSVLLEETAVTLTLTSR